MNVVERLTRFVQCVFKTNLEIFLEALKLSPSTQGYVGGSISEFLLKKKLEEEYGFEVKRILEKWEGKKHPNHRGDFYFRKLGAEHWYVMESKGIKSNSEDWHRLYNHDNLKKFLLTHADKIVGVNHNEDIEPQITAWLKSNLPRFQEQYVSNLYGFQEVRDYLKSPPKRETEKLRAMAVLRNFSREQINAMIEERLGYLRSRVKVLETHFPVGTSGSGERTQATPRKDEFNAVAIDIFLGYPEHKFLFANPQHLEPSGDDANHLQQNYVMGFVFTDEQGNVTLSIADDWYEDFKDVYDTLDAEDSISEGDMQVDNRYMAADEADETPGS